MYSVAGDGQACADLGDLQLVLLLLLPSSIQLKIQLQQLAHTVHGFHHCMQGLEACSQHRCCVARCCVARCWSLLRRALLLLSRLLLSRLLLSRLLLSRLLLSRLLLSSMLLLLLRLLLRAQGCCCSSLLLSSRNVICTACDKHAWHHAYRDMAELH